MTRDALDFMSTPNAGLLAQLDLDAWPYTGPARPALSWFVNMKAGGHPVLVMIRESYPNRAQAGFDAGVADCIEAERRAREVSPDIAAIDVVVSDGTSTDPSTGAYWISEYGRGWGITAALQFFPYGNAYATAAFLHGAQPVTHLCLPGEHLPETWGYGRVATQVVGYSPVGATDLNHVHIDIGAPAPLPPLPRRRHTMLLGHRAPASGNVWNTALIEGGVVLRWFGGATTATPYGTFYTDALNFQKAHDLDRDVVVFSEGEWGPIERRTTATQT